MSFALAPTAGELRIEYLAEIATGSTARVDLCRASGPRFEGRLVAVKRLRPELANEPDLVSRFLDEVRLTAALRHPNVVEVVGWGVDAQGKYLAVELVEGVSLARLRKTVFDTGEEFSERLVVHIAACICRGLVAAHTLAAPTGEPLHIVHRDLTPDNVLVGFNGDLKISDFGLAKAKQRITATTSKLPMRPAVQIAPEELTGGRVDHRADIFALGVLMFELLARRPPWIGDDPIDTLARIARDPPPDLGELRPKVDKELTSVVLACLEKDPASRSPHAGAVLARLDRWLEGRAFARGNAEALARFVRRNAMRQMRWFELAIAGSLPTTDAPPPADAVRGGAAISPGEARVKRGVEAAPGAVPRPSSSAPPQKAPRGKAPAPFAEPRHPLRAREESASIPIELRPERVVPRPRVPRVQAPPEEDAERTLVQGKPEPVAIREAPPLDAAPPSSAPTSPLARRVVVEDSTTVTMVREDLLRTAAQDDDAAEHTAIDALAAAKVPRAALSESIVTEPGRPRAASAAEQIVIDASRIRALSARRAQEAREAAADAERAVQRAARTAELARLTEEAAALAASAASVAAQGGLAEASHKMERARALEAVAASKVDASGR